MKETIASILIIACKNNYLRDILYKYYQVGINKLLGALLKVYPDITIYSKSDLSSKSFAPAVSDIDFVIVTNTNEKNIQLRINKLFKSLNVFYPFIKDYDLYSNQEFNFLLQFGGVKTLNSKNWELLNGEDLRVESYTYFPHKFIADQINELYFLIEWFFLNLNLLEKSNNLYRRSVLKRTLKKIFSLIYWIEKQDTFDKPKLESLTDSDLSMIDKILSDFDSTIIREKFYNYLINKKVFEAIEESLPLEYEWPEQSYKHIVNEIAEEYIFEDGLSYTVPRQKNLGMIKHTNNIIIPRSVFNLFHKLGCIDPKVLFLNWKNNQSNLIGTFNLMQLFAKEITSSKFIIETRDELPKREVLQKKIKYEYIVSRNTPLNYLNKTVFVTVNWGYSEDRSKSMLSAMKKNVKQCGEFEFLHINLNIRQANNIKLLKALGITTVSFNAHKSSEKLWHKEALYNIAIDFAFGAKNFIFTDADVYSLENTWLEQIKNQLDSGFDFVHGFDTVVDTIDKNYHYESWTKKYLNGESSLVAPGLVWGVKSKTLREIKNLPDSLPDGSCDGAFIQEMTGTAMGFVNDFKWYRSKIRKHKRDFKISYCPVNVVHINHGPSRDYDNRGVLLDLVNFDFSEAYKKNMYGFYEWYTQDDDKIYSILLKNFIYELTPEEFVKLFDRLVDRDLVRIPDNFRFVADDNINNELIVENGVAFLFVEDQGYKIFSSTQNTDKTQMKLRFGGFDMMDNEYIHFKFNIDNNGDRFFADVLYNWWHLFGANDLNYKFFKNRDHQIIEVVPSSWGDHVPMFVDLIVDKPSPGNMYKVNKVIEDHINIHHAWDLLEEIELTPNDVEIKNNSMWISLENTLDYDHGWYRLELSFEDTKSQGIKYTVTSGTAKVPITATRKLSDCNIPYKRIAFYKNLYTRDLKMFIKFIDSKSCNFGKVKVAVKSRRVLK